MSKSTTRLTTPLVLLLFLLLAPHISPAQVIDTLAIQDFELSPQAPVWTYTGTPNAFLGGTSGTNATPPLSPIGINGSLAWHLVQVSGGNPVTFDNQMINSGYDSIRVRFRLAAMNLNGPTGGPDHLDYVLCEYSTNGGTSWVNRLRVRGSIANNCSWAYSATGLAYAYYLPTTEVVFQPTTSGLQTTQGMSTVELVFPGTISDLSIRITPRSSSGSDHWMIDNLVLLGENACTATSATITANACDSYTSPSGNYTWTSSNMYQDTILNSNGCDSVLSINLTVNNSSTATLNVDECNDYTSPSGKVWTTTNTYLDTIPNAIGCDSLLTINLTINQDRFDTLTETACVRYTSPSGLYTWTTSNTYQDTISTVANCDSVLTINLTIVPVDTAVTVSGNVLSANASNATYQWINCSNNLAIPGATAQTFTPAANGNYAVIVTENGCSDTSACRAVTVVGLQVSLRTHIRMWPNPASNHLNLALDPQLGEASLQILDTKGRQVLQQHLAPGKIHAVPVARLAPGIYFAEIRSGEQRLRLKFFKE